MMMDTIFSLASARGKAGKPLDLGQIQAVVLKRPARELPRFGQPQPIHTGQMIEQRPHHGDRPMRLKLHDRLAGKAGSLFENENQRRVDQAVGPRKLHERRMARGRDTARQVHQRIIGARPRNPYDRHPRTARRGGLGYDGVHCLSL